MRGCLIKIFLFLVGFFVVLVGVVFFLYQSAQRIPDFYQAALEIDVEKYEAAGDEFESQVLKLQNDLQVEGRWEAEFTQEQINGWLATDMPKKFPDTLPRNVRDPRVAITSGKIKLAFKFESSRFSGIVVCEGDVYCTDQSNQLAIRIDDVRAGVVSLPISKWLDEVSDGISRSGFSMQWTEEDGKPVALVTLPSDTIGGGDVIVESIELLEGKVRLKGQTTEPGQSVITFEDIVSSLERESIR